VESGTPSGGQRVEVLTPDTNPPAFGTRVDIEGVRAARDSIVTQTRVREEHCRQPAVARRRSQFDEGAASTTSNCKINFRSTQPLGACLVGKVVFGRRVVDVTSQGGKVIALLATAALSYSPGQVFSCTTSRRSLSQPT
jgi:hypothetical protein